MSYEEANKEIETIKGRTFTLQLSDADCLDVMKKAGSVGMTVPELLENFIGDLVYGTFSNGSDECELANAWFDRCGFSMLRGTGLLNYLLYDGIDVEEFLNVLDEIKTAKQDLERYKAHPEEYDEDEIAALEEDIAAWEEEYNEFTKSFREAFPNADMEKDIEGCRKWYEEYKKITEGDNKTPRPRMHL